MLPVAIVAAMRPHNDHAVRTIIPRCHDDDGGGAISIVVGT